MKGADTGRGEDQQLPAFAHPDGRQVDRDQDRNRQGEVEYLRAGKGEHQNRVKQVGVVVDDIAKHHRKPFGQKNRLNESHRGQRKPQDAAGEALDVVGQGNLVGLARQKACPLLADESAFAFGPWHQI